MTDQTLQALERLAKLKEQGALTQAEYDKQKASLLATEPPRPAKKKLSVRRALFYGIMGFMAIGLIGVLTEKTPPPAPQQNAQSDSIQAANARDQKLRRDVDMAPYKARRAIKKALKDPDSFEEIEHRAGFVGEKGIYISCLVTYRAKNSFGGYGVEKMLVNFNEALEPIGLVPIEQ